MNPKLETTTSEMEKTEKCKRHNAQKTSKIELKTCNAPTAYLFDRWLRRGSSVHQSSK